MKNISTQELEARVHVRSERFFYQEARLAIAVIIFFFITWMLSGFGQCWPVWFALGWGASLLWRGVRLGILDASWLEKSFGLKFQKYTDHWEDQKVQAMLERAAVKEHVAPSVRKTSLERAAVKEHVAPSVRKTSQGSKAESIKSKKTVDKK